MNKQIPRPKYKRGDVVIATVLIEIGKEVRIVDCLIRSMEYIDGKWIYNMFVDGMYPQASESDILYKLD